MSVNIPEVKLVRTVWIFRGKIEDILAGAHSLHITSNLVNSRGCQSENGIEMYTNGNARAGLE